LGFETTSTSISAAFPSHFQDVQPYKQGISTGFPPSAGHFKANPLPTQDAITASLLQSLAQTARHMAAAGASPGQVAPLFEDGALIRAVPLGLVR